MKRVLVLNHHGFGNVVMSIPLLRALASHTAPDGALMLLLNSREHYELLREEHLGAEPLFLHPEHEGPLGLLKLAAKLRHKVDLLLAVPQIPPTKVAILKLLLSARTSAAEALPRSKFLVDIAVPKTWTKPILQSQRELLGALGIEADNEAPKITLSSEERAWSTEMCAQHKITRSTRIGIHCGASQKSKQWSEENFAAVITELSRAIPSLAVVSFGGKLELGSAQTARRNSPPLPWVEGCGEWSIRETLAMLAQCHLVISGDTAIMHMAAAVGTSTLSLFGPTSPLRLAPPGSTADSLHPDLPCHPCYRDHFTRCECLNLIPAEAVVNAALKRIQVT